METFRSTEVEKHQPEQFIPLQDFFSRYEQHRFITYQGRFSFEPLLKHLQTHATDSRSSFMERIGLHLRQADYTSAAQDAIDADFHLLFPSLFTNAEIGFIEAPFSNALSIFTPAFRQIFIEDEWEIQWREDAMDLARQHTAFNAIRLIMQRLYNREVDNPIYQLVHMRHRKTGLERFYKMRKSMDYVELKIDGEVPELSPAQMHHLLNEWRDEVLWASFFPRDLISFEGLVIVRVEDVTEKEILSLMKDMMLTNEKEVDYGQGIQYLTSLARNFFQLAHLDFGSLYVKRSNWQSNTEWMLLRHFDNEMIFAALNDAESAYGRAYATGQPVIVGDLSETKKLSALERALLEKGYRSLLLYPMHLQPGIVGGIMEIASDIPYQFNGLTVEKAKPFADWFRMGMISFIEEIENSVRAVMQQQFTAIHPSVEWKFKEVATQYYWARTSGQEMVAMPPIVFNNVFPLYGQADIVSSSNLRNRYVAEDLKYNLTKVLNLMQRCRDQINFHLLNIFIHRVKQYLERLEAGDFVSRDETQIVDLLVREVHPLLQELRRRYPAVPDKLFEEYFQLIDPKLGIVYHHRKAFEQSVSQLNGRISAYLEGEDEKMQGILPHYFERYKTDGVEYNIYIGSSIVENNDFSDFLLQDFRLWQLQTMIQITRLVHQLGSELPVPLSTAQLIFVYNHALSIRFRQDEKQFDVDGAYNVRYAILKKRIDKAIVKGTGERLTVKNKIAIVYLQEKEREEYLRYLNYLREEGMIEPTIEELQLEKMQGAEGVQALRVTVNLDPS